MSAAMIRASLCFVLVLGCADNQDQTPPGSVAAAQVSYANATTGLPSTNVQDAIDDVVGIGDDLEQRVSTLEAAAPAAHRTIICRYATASLTLGIGVTVAHVFTAAECGGTLPDASYVGAVGAFDSCTSRLNAIRVMNAGEADGPGMVLRKADENTAACTGPAELTAIYFKR